MLLTGCPAPPQPEPETETPAVVVPPAAEPEPVEEPEQAADTPLPTAAVAAAAATSLAATCLYLDLPKEVQQLAEQTESPDELIAPYHIPENIEMVVVGGETNAFWKTTDFRYVMSASVDAWR